MIGFIYYIYIIYISSWSEFDEFWPPATIRKFKKTLNISTIHYQHWSTIQLWDSTPIIWRISSFILAPEVIGVLVTRYCALFFIFYALLKICRLNCDGKTLKLLLINGTMFSKIVKVCTIWFDQLLIRSVF